MFVPAEKPDKPLVGMVVYDRTAHQLQYYTGTTWIAYKGLGVYCVICKQEPLKHETKDGHPFCEDNLEMLEWKAETKNS